ncbi:hypothetical protein CXB49_00160 [Chromobacterium sp. ATCC 53434]|uniref:hypothetical protein n=1 Tax=Chromobacterium TaxID=535 RepID=UPI000C79384D|nr:hypothetical protein [Chromobacterium sp. ATCC 53434]AUH53463.1 hypothetical protein CXB49_00160 [Chromobacterium sp. ATCC 53434]
MKERWQRILICSALYLSMAAVLGGCSSMGAVGGATAGLATGLITSNPAIGIGVGIAVQATTDEAINRYMRSMHNDQQNLIATVAGGLPVGEIRPWRIKHTFPIENNHGRVRVTRTFTTALVTCKDLLFSVAVDDTPNAYEDWYATSACRQGSIWKWASAEPAVARWGNLH